MLRVQETHQTQAPHKELMEVMEILVPVIFLVAEVELLLLVVVRLALMLA